MEVSLHAILNSIIREISFRPGVPYSGETPYGTHYEISFLSNAPLFPNKYCFFRSTHASLNMSMEYWWKDTEREKPKHSEKSLSQRHPVHHRYHNH